MVILFLNSYSLSLFAEYQPELVTIKQHKVNVTAVGAKVEVDYLPEYFTQFSNQKPIEVMFEHKNDKHGSLLVFTTYIDTLGQETGGIISDISLKPLFPTIIQLTPQLLKLPAAMESEGLLFITFRVMYDDNTLANIDNPIIYELKKQEKGWQILLEKKGDMAIDIPSIESTNKTQY
ncbi:hypothetical protein [Aliikangiella sp. IMCC44359]|uniref:hypothetical protein n=1 Tax=Aliikangiella sp. IMCC44359 TaxID=3459125 RepID=UPI00403B0F9B